MLKNVLIVGFGGFAGSVLRYLVYLLSVSNGQPKNFYMMGTFLVNIIGCFLIGLFWGILETHDWFTEEIRLFLMVGFCGGFTTFSSYALDGFVISKTNIGESLLYLGSSIFVGMILVYLGHTLIKITS